MNDVIVQFAVLWGQFIGSAMNEVEAKIADEMKQYDSEELLPILSEWAREYFENEYGIEDTVEFFHEKLCELIPE